MDNDSAVWEPMTHMLIIQLTTVGIIEEALSPFLQSEGCAVSTHTWNRMINAFLARIDKGALSKRKKERWMAPNCILLYYTRGIMRPSIVKYAYSYSSHSARKWYKAPCFLLSLFGRERLCVFFNVFFISIQREGRVTIRLNELRLFAFVALRIFRGSFYVKYARVISRDLSRVSHREI